MVLTKTSEIGLGGAWRLIEDATAQRLVPGAAVGVVDASGRSAIAIAGSAQWAPDTIALRQDMWFDLASLTKVMLTVTEVLHLRQAGELDLDDPLARFLPEIDADVGRLTLRQILIHQAGFEPFAPFQHWCDDADELRARVVRYQWQLGEPVYSDIGYILLGIMLERIHEKPLDRFATPPGLGFHPPPDQTVATEDCSWRGRVLRGEVHDERAFALGGAAGHAGLFGTIAGVLDFAHGMLVGDLLSAESMSELRRPHTDTRALGWVLKHPNWSGGQACSDATLGHTGFTGTGLWLDFARGHGWTLLTNRVHPSPERTPSIGALRRSVGEAIAR